MIPLPGRKEENWKRLNKRKEEGVKKLLLKTQTI